MISIERSFFEKFPRLAHGPARVLSRPVVGALRAVACEDRINRALADLAPFSGFAFVERVLESFDVNYRIAHNERENIPTDGRVIIVANHPLGAFDALALLHLVGSIRRDVRILANDVLAQFKPLANLLLPVNVFGGSDSASVRLRTVYRALEQEHAVIVFPSGEVSRITPPGVRDRRWSAGFVRIARQVEAPVLPVHIAAHNSATFYGVSMLAKPLSSLLLAREMFGAAHSTPTIAVGEMVPADALGSAPSAVVAEKMRRHVYQIGKRRTGLFATARAIAHPESPLAIRDALRRAESLGPVADGKRVLLLDADPDCPVLREISRLRELSFRSVGEGTGARRDTDRFDLHYRHLVLWDEQALAIVGAYRLAEGARILSAHGIGGLYSSTLFDYAPQAGEFIAQGVELGRSFIQPAYWNSRSLDSLWQGIGAYLRRHPEVRYLFGPVSISARLPEAARHWIAHFHRHYFGDADSLATARNRLPPCPQIDVEARALWHGQDLRAAQVLLKKRLAQIGGQIPVLYKHYVDLCEPGGVRFLDFGQDTAFANCVDGLIRLDLSLMRPAKRERYLH
jgi:putative hemolysin